ncbi:Variant surface glycoprotein [Trypanosoma congolense IL3000]|uniref:Variant surface glycoprotein n=1 Tax=Trypanosoma congolense (strain IL3000) TaxID=1068625 RepID=F9WEM0_TRYCI|nr:Variant surface glycoprotein [Trypanosoma congolense IL3000]
MKIQFLVFICAVGAVAGAEDGGSVVPKDHNKDAHNALCNLMKAAVTKWGDGGKTLSPPLKKALGRTLFGKDDGGTVDTLKGKLPDDYEGVVKQTDSRNFACGQPRNDQAGYGNLHQVRWSGHSAPHDMVCLCTAGSYGWPINGTGPSTTLCGKDKGALKADNKKGWDSANQGEDEQGKEQINATWVEVVTQCLQGGKGGDLKQALNTFTESLVHKSGDEVHKNRKQLGEGTPNNYTGCSGSPKLGVCVMYYPDDKHATPWWIELPNALKEDEQLQKQRQEEEKRKQQEEAAKKDTNKTEDIKSTTPTTNQTEQNKTATLHETIRKLNLTSGTPISRPTSWLLSALLLI